MRKILFYLFLIASISFTAKAQITIDGTMTDWDNVPILSEPGVFPMAKVLNDGTNLSFMVNLGTTETFNPSAWNIVDLYLDADFDATTGFKQWVYVSSGMDYLAQGSDLYKYSGTGGSSAWSWGSAGSIIDRKLSADLHSIEEAILVSNFSGPILGAKYAVGLPYYNSTYTTGDPTFFPLNNWDFAERKGFVVKSRTEVSLATTADFTSANAYYLPFMKDENIAQYLDFQSGAYDVQNPLQWASWAFNLASPGIYDFKMTSSALGSGKAQLSIINMATNAVVKTLPEVWFPANATMTENSYSTIDLSGLQAGKYMLKLRNLTTWDNTYLKVEKVTLSKVATAVKDIDSDKISIRTFGNKLEISSLEPIDITIFNTTGQMIASSKQLKNASFHLQNNIYILKVNQNGKVYSRKIVIS